MYLANKRSKVKTLLPRIAERDIKTLNDNHHFKSGIAAINHNKDVLQSFQGKPNEYAQDDPRYKVANLLKRVTP